MYEANEGSWWGVNAQAAAHYEWHWNTGIPMGTPGCPQDACHYDDDYMYADEEPTYGPFTWEIQAPPSDEWPF